MVLLFSSPETMLEFVWVLILASGWMGAKALTEEINLDDQLILKIKGLMDTNGTDKGLYNPELFEGDILLKDPFVKSSVRDPRLLWPEGIITYKISDNIGCPYSRQCFMVKSAMEEYHKKTCLRFKEWSGESDYVDIFYNNQNSGACWSEVGRSGRIQKLSLGGRCWFPGIVVHELGHALGLWHEMNRPDRNKYVIIHWSNILQGFISAFIRNPSSTVSTLGEPFDLKSIMMYDEYAFSKDGRSPTIETRSKEVIGPLWKKNGLSPTDIRKIHKMYQCDGSNPKIHGQYHFKCNFKLHDCGFHNIGKPIWKWNSVKSNANMVASSKYAGLKGRLASINFLETSDRNNTLGCLSFTYFLSSSFLQVNQETFTSVTDLVKSSTVKLWNSTNDRKWYSVQMNINITNHYRVVFEMESKSTMSSAAIDNVEISPRICELLMDNL